MFPAFDVYIGAYLENLPDSVKTFFTNQADVIEASNSTSRYLDNLLNIDNP